MLGLLYFMSRHEFGSCLSGFLHLPQKPCKNLPPMIDKHLRHLIAVRILILTGMHRSIVEAENLSPRDPQKNRRVGDNKKLSSLPGAFVNLCQKRQLPLRRESRLRLIQEVQSVGS